MRMPTHRSQRLHTETLKVRKLKKTYYDDIKFQKLWLVEI